MSMINCRFCNLPIEKSRFTAHYRKKHRNTDLAEARIIATRDVVRLTREDIDRIIGVIEEPSLEYDETYESAPYLTEYEPDFILPEHDCMMCLEKHTTVLEPCNHTSSCRDCLARWWRESYYLPRCPICRTEVLSMLQDGEEDENTISSWYMWRRRQLSRGERRERTRLPSYM